jgi:hypothetical protein
MELPDFCLADYDRLLDRLLAAGYEFSPVEELPRIDTDRAMLLRHDIDSHILGIERMAEIESCHGVSATYYVLLTSHYNPFYCENRNILHQIVAGGHKIGLHYDLQTYPRDEVSAWEHLDAEVTALEALVGAQVESICMHNPWGGLEDIFRLSDRYVHPHDPRYADRLVYVSDSCRAWRDETLLRCFGEAPPQLLLLNTHPELWLGEPGIGRDEFVRGTMLENTVSQHRAYIADSVIPGWGVHPAAKLHDERERGGRLCAESSGDGRG